MSVVRIEGKYCDILNVVPEDTYLMVHYKDKVVKGGGLQDTGWRSLQDGIVKVAYHLSTGTVIEIPPIFKAYLHLVEVSKSIYTNKIVYHYVYIKCLDQEDVVVSYRISLKQDKAKNLNIGDIYISKETLEECSSPYWKKAKVNKELLLKETTAK